MYMRTILSFWSTLAKSQRLACNLKLDVYMLQPDFELLTSLQTVLPDYKLVGLF